MLATTALPKTYQRFVAPYLKPHAYASTPKLSLVPDTAR